VAAEAQDDMQAEMDGAIYRFLDTPAYLLCLHIMLESHFLIPSEIMKSNELLLSVRRSVGHQIWGM
jgi:hypothetical protein